MGTISSSNCIQLLRQKRFLHRNSEGSITWEERLEDFLAVRGYSLPLTDEQDKELSSSVAYRGLRDNYEREKNNAPMTKHYNYRKIVL